MDVPKFSTLTARVNPWHVARFALPALAFLVVITVPLPGEITEEGQRVLAVSAVALILWSSGLLPMAVTGLLSIVLLTVTQGVPTVEDALFGFSQPITYFLVGVLTIGLAVLRTGLAERLAHYLIERAGGRPGALYAQMIASFVPLTFVLPSATTRTAVLIHIYEEVLRTWGIPDGSALAKLFMLGLATLNRLASTAVLTGGIAPITAAALLGGFSWTRWFALMAVPYYALLLAGAFLLYLMYRRGLKITPPSNDMALQKPPFSFDMLKVAVIIVGASILWLTDSVHGLHPAIPALIALILLVSPGIGVLTWRDLEKDLGWSNFFVLATSLSMANALVSSGAAGWLAQGALTVMTSASFPAPVTLLLLMAGASILRFAIPNIVGFLALTIPVAISLAGELGLNPLVVGLAVTIAGDAVLYYPAQGSASVVVFERGHLTAPEVFRFGLGMTIVAYTVVFVVALAYWAVLGEPLTP